MIALTEAPAQELGADLLHMFAEFHKALAGEGLLPLCLGASFVVLIIVGSAAVSSSIAESRLRNRNFHFLVGLLIPVLYPLVAMALMSRKKFKSDEEEEEKDYQSQARASASGKTSAKDEMPDLFSHDYFKEMMYDSNGNARGPFMMRIDETELRVEHISEVLDQVVVIETINADGKQQTMRLPFVRITGCREI